MHSQSEVNLVGALSAEFGSSGFGHKTNSVEHLQIERLGIVHCYE